MSCSQWRDFLKDQLPLPCPVGPCVKTIIHSQHENMLSTFDAKYLQKKAFYLKPTLPKYCQCDEKCNILYWIPIILLSWAYFWHNGKFVSYIYSLQRKATPSNLQTFYKLLSNKVPFKAPSFMTWCHCCITNKLWKHYHYYFQLRLIIIDRI